MFGAYPQWLNTILVNHAADLCREVGGDEICSILEIGGYTSNKLSAMKYEPDQKLVSHIDTKDTIESSHKALADVVGVEYEWLLL